MSLEQTDMDGRAVTTSREVGGSVRSMISRSDEGHESSEVNTVWQNIHYNQATWSAEDITETLYGFVQV